MTKKNREPDLTVDEQKMPEEFAAEDAGGLSGFGEAQRGFFGQMSGGAEESLNSDISTRVISANTSNATPDSRPNFTFKVQFFPRRAFVR